MTETLYERLGGRQGVGALVDDFYDSLVEDSELTAFFEDADVERLRRVQTDFLCEAAGGPETYDAEPVREAHAHIPFEPHHIHRAVDILRKTLEDHGVDEEDADTVVGAVAEYSDDLLADPTD